ncbi:MAG: hypothetical protein U0892_13020 [Pirellulales bacterium]
MPRPTVHPGSAQELNVRANKKSKYRFYASDVSMGRDRNQLVIETTALAGQAAYKFIGTFAGKPGTNDGAHPNRATYAVDLKPEMVQEQRVIGIPTREVSVTVTNLDDGSYTTVTDTIELIDSPLNPGVSRVAKKNLKTTSKASAKPVKKASAKPAATKKAAKGVKSSKKVAKKKSR